MKFSKVSLQERIEQNEKELDELKRTTENFKSKYYELNNKSVKLFSKYTLEKEENERLKEENENLRHNNEEFREENEKLKNIVEALIDECESLLNTTFLKNKVSTVYSQAIIYYAISTLGTTYKK